MISQNVFIQCISNHTILLKNDLPKKLSSLKQVYMEILEITSSWIFKKVINQRDLPENMRLKIGMK